MGLVTRPCSSPVERDHDRLYDAFPAQLVPGVILVDGLPPQYGCGGTDEGGAVVSRLG